MLNAARDRAMEALLDQRVFELSEEGEQQVRDLFEQRLTAMPQAAELLARRPVWRSEPHSD